MNTQDALCKFLAVLQDTGHKPKDVKAALRFFSGVAQPEQPEQPAASKAVAYRYRFKGDLQWQYTETLAQATQPCEIQYLYIAQPVQPALTCPTNSQNWAGMDGATAFHLIERHSGNWSDAQMMMNEWRIANSIAQPVQPASHNLQKRLEALHLYEEIAEHYAKCAVSPEALRDWVAERINSKPAAKKAKT